MNKDHKDGFLHQTQPALKTKYIVHFSDNHLYYKEKSKDESQRNDGSKDNYVLDSNNRAAPDHEIIQPAYGEDAPLELIEIAMQYAKDMIEKPAFFLYTGDSNSHPHGNYYKDSVWITSVIGNTDSRFYMPIPEMGKEITTIAVIADAWKDTLTHEEMEQLKLYGYVAYPVDEKLVVITLNTIVYATNYRRGEELLADPLGQFKRLEKELDKLREEGKVAYICGHVPPSVGSYKGKLQWLSDYIQKYISIVESYGDVIKAQLFGHLHSNEYLNNPAFIIWEYNPTTYELTDFVLHGTDITKEYPYVAFKPLFRATDAYGLEDLSLGSLRKLVTKMETNNGDNDLVRNYHWNSKAQSPKFYV
ncbi:unnamed protein product [Albugo candida]|uniref:Calcineurin-like phosphoesterase domain-containing protein n=1 Tax=Albugo candida TaxID=65357 RepID=A0A024G6V0_9STRA|nr:unnamed protein product [Albugo candida]|eukprot:CCI42606.1 unnamed protein product [Albugo candida]